MRSKKLILLVLFYVCFITTVLLIVTDKCNANFLRAIGFPVSITGMLTFGVLWMIDND